MGGTETPVGFGSSGKDTPFDRHDEHVLSSQREAWVGVSLLTFIDVVR